MRFRSSDLLSFTSPQQNYSGYLCGGGAPSPEDYVGLTHNNLQIDNVPTAQGFGKGMIFLERFFFFFFFGMFGEFFFRLGIRSIFFGDGWSFRQENVC